MFMLLLAFFFVISTGMRQYAQDLSDPDYARHIIETNGQFLLRDARFAYLEGTLDHPGMRRQIECAHRTLDLVQQSHTDPTSFCWPNTVLTHDLRDINPTAPSVWRQRHAEAVLELVRGYSFSISFYSWYGGRP